ncbi:hypothetical protein [Neisseria sp. P0019.S003]|uniref:hypothetical protein n=1 Tax=Neisseria sp. P0019.S003 TaxID=3436799 RepID=UPI003F7D3453
MWCGWGFVCWGVGWGFCWVGGFVVCGCVLVWGLLGVLVGLGFVGGPFWLGVVPGGVISGVAVVLMVINDSIQCSVKAVVHQYHLGADEAVRAGALVVFGE